MPQISPEKIVAAAEKNGYARGKFSEEDAQTDNAKYKKKTKAMHDPVLHRYATWHWDGIAKEYKAKGLRPPSFETVQNKVLRENAPAPSTEEVKDFIRFYINASKGRLGEKPSVESMKSRAEDFYRAFTHKTKTSTDPSQRSEVYWWIKYYLPSIGVLKDVTKPKHNMEPVDLDRIIQAIWCDLKFSHERSIVQNHLLLMLYTTSGGRNGALFEEGLTYRDIEIVQTRRTEGGYGYLWRFDQRYTKGNRNPENDTLGTPGSDHSCLLYNTTGLILALAFADGALFGYNSLDEFWEQDIPDGDTEVVFRWNTGEEEEEDGTGRDVRMLPIIRAINKDGTVSDRKLSQSTFYTTFKSALDHAGYVGVAPSVHQIRRFLGKQIDERYTEVERSQHLGQSDPRIFGQSYVANCSWVDGRSAFLGEAPDHRASRYFQGLGKYYERGAPTELPAARELALENDPQVLELKERISTTQDPWARQEASRALVSLRRTLKRKALDSYRKEWVRKRRDWKILTRGKESAQEDHGGGQLINLIPARQRLAELMMLKTPLDTADMREAIQDLYTLCTMDCSVIYYPGEEPIDGKCRFCGISMMSFKDPRRRSTHAHACCKTQMAEQHAVKSSSLWFCRPCAEWFTEASQWDEHCLSHLAQPSKHCGALFTNNTLVRPAYCPWCIVSNQSPAKRLLSWEREADAIKHIKEEELNHTYPAYCDFCDVELLNDTDVDCHLIDAHGFSRPSKFKGTSRKRKRDEPRPSLLSGVAQGVGPTPPIEPMDASISSLFTPEETLSVKSEESFLLGNQSQGLATYTLGDIASPGSQESLDDFMRKYTTFSPSLEPLEDTTENQAPPLDETVPYYDLTISDGAYDLTMEAMRAGLSFSDTPPNSFVDTNRLCPELREQESPYVEVANKRIKLKAGLNMADFPNKEPKKESKGVSQSSGGVKRARIKLVNWPGPVAEPLSKAQASADAEGSHPCAIDEREHIWTVEALLAKWQRGKRVLYLIKWKGFPHDANTWGKPEDILDAGLIRTFEESFLVNGGNYMGVKLLQQRIRRGKPEYLVRWQGRPDDENSWEKESTISSGVRQTGDELN